MFQTFEKGNTFQCRYPWVRYCMGGWCLWCLQFLYHKLLRNGHLVQHPALFYYQHFTVCLERAAYTTSQSLCNCSPHITLHINSHFVCMNIHLCTFQNAMTQTSRAASLFDVALFSPGSSLIWQVIWRPVCCKYYNRGSGHQRSKLTWIN